MIDWNYQYGTIWIHECFFIKNKPIHLLLQLMQKFCYSANCMVLYGNIIDGRTDTIYWHVFTLLSLWFLFENLFYLNFFTFYNKIELITTNIEISNII